MKGTRAELKEFMQLSGKSQRQISKETGVSTSVISQFLEGTYTGNNEKVEQTVKQYLKVSKERLNSVQSTVFYEELYNTKNVLFACAYAHKRNDIALVSGDAGAGKTTALEYYTRNNTGVIMVTADSCTTTATAILKVISEKFGKQTDYKKSVLMKELISHLKGTNRLIIIDEADHLTFQALQAVRNLNDMAKVGVILSGNNKIYRQMLKGQKGEDFDQIRTRIFVRKMVVNDYTPEEIMNIFGKLDERSIAFIMEIAMTESLRTAKKLYEIALEYAGAMGEALGVKHLRQTREQLFGGAY